MNDSIQTSSVPIFGFDPYLIRYSSIFLLFVGTFGNVISFIIFFHSKLCKSSTFRYLAILSLMDLVVLYSGLFDLYLMIGYRGDFSLRLLNPLGCRLHTFITYWSQHSSSWILAFISVDRAVATNCIKFAKKYCTPRSAEYIVLIIIVVIALVNCHELIFLHLQYENNNEDNHDFTTISSTQTSQSITHKALIEYDSNVANKSLTKRAICDFFKANSLCARNKRNVFISSTISINTLLPKPRTIIRKCAAPKNSEYEFFWDNVWEWIDVCLYALIPFTVMSIGTFLIVYRVYYQQRRVFRSHRSGAHRRIGAIPNKAKSLFYLLFTLNLLYFILVSPVVFVTTLLFRNQNEEFAYPRLKAIIYSMQYGNHSLNFIFYGITSPIYRRTLYNWFRMLIPYLPRCCQNALREPTKTNRKQTKLKPKHLKSNNDMNLTTPDDQFIRKESNSLIPR